MRPVIGFRSPFFVRILIRVPFWEEPFREESFREEPFWEEFLPEESKEREKFYYFYPKICVWKEFPINVGCLCRAHSASRRFTLSDRPARYIRQW